LKIRKFRDEKEGDTKGESSSDDDEPGTPPPFEKTRLTRLLPSGLCSV